MANCSHLPERRAGDNTDGVPPAGWEHLMDSQSVGRDRRVGVRIQRRESSFVLDPESTDGGTAAVQRVQVATVIAQCHVDRSAAFAGQAGGVPI